MKAVPILVVTNALALGLVVVLFVQQGDLKSQLSATRASTARRTDVAEEGAVQDRIARLERLLRARSGEETGWSADTGPGEGSDPAMAAEGATQGGEDAPAGSAEAGTEEGGEYDPQEMEQFRKKVRRAIELNGEEDQVNRVVGRLDSLVQENRIAPLSAKQKATVARAILSAQRKVPEVFRRMRQSGDLANVPREERGQLIRAEFENLRMEAQKELENTIPAADAKTITEDYLADRGMFRGMGRGAFGPPGGRSTGNRTGGRTRGG